MPTHEYFEELCSLAVLGEVSGAEQVELGKHVRQCASCRAVLADFVEFANEHLPIADRVRKYPANFEVLSSGKFRESTLQHVTAEGLRISPEAWCGPVGFVAKVSEWIENFRWSIRTRTLPLGVAASILVLAATGAFLLRRDVAQKHEVETLQADLMRAQSGASQLQEKLDQARGTESRTATDRELEVAKLEQHLADAGARAIRLEAEHQQDLDHIQSVEARVKQLELDKTATAQHATESDATLAGVRTELQQLRAASDDKEAQLVAAQYRVTELSNQLKGQESAMNNERLLLAAGRDIRDLMGARDLHIIDVHDIKPYGEARPFGRIFLTEGKRLIFYAYDLDTVKTKNASFQVWGQGNDGERKAVNLGIFYMDDHTQSRWALKVEDPNLLKAIDSVFVTVEPHGGTTKPTGQRLMYAYLRNPINHP
jgi:hypothetical protein